VDHLNELVEQYLSSPRKRRDVSRYLQHRVCTEFSFGAFPLLSPARRLAARGVAPDGSRVNVRNLKPRTALAAGVTEDDVLLLCDAQTSGGLLVALPRESAEIYVARCRQRGAVAAAVVGSVLERGETLLRVKP
jgi:selenide,water dikinase